MGLTPEQAAALGADVDQPALKLCPMTITAAKAFVAAHHRHHLPPQGGLFAVGVSRGGVVVGVAIVGRPVARRLQDGWTAEVTRVATDGSRNACSMLLGACWRAAKAIGYRRIFTYTLDTEGGASLRGAGWVCDGLAGGGSWDSPSRRRVDKAPTCRKVRWRAGERCAQAVPVMPTQQSDQMALGGI